MKNIQAFPGTKQTHDPHGSAFLSYQSGMDLRDYFAGQALTGLLSNAEALAQLARKFKDGSSPSTIALSAYTVADAMLIQREK